MPELALPSGPPTELGEGAMEAGTYKATAFDPPLTFTLGEGWSALFAPDEDEIALDGPDGSFLNITRVTEVMDPQTDAPVAAPDDLIAWLAALPGVTESEPMPIEVAGLAAQSIDLSLGESAPEIETFVYPTGNMRIPPGTHDRYIVIPLDGPDLTIVFGSGSECGLDAVMPMIQPILDSLAISEG